MGALRACKPNARLAELFPCIPAMSGILGRDPDRGPAGGSDLLALVRRSVQIFLGVYTVKRKQTSKSNVAKSRDILHLASKRAESTVRRKASGKEYQRDLFGWEEWEMVNGRARLVQRGRD